MPRVLLVYPQFPETFWGYQRALRFLGLRATHPPLGLLTVAGMLPEDYELRLVDLNVEAVEAEDWRWADIVLTGGMMIQRPSVERIVEQCLAAQVPVVIGGPDVTSSSQDLPAAAHLVLGEAESPKLIEGLSEMIVAKERIVLDLRDELQRDQRLAPASVRHHRDEELRFHGASDVARLPLQMRVLRHPVPVRR